MADFVAVIRRAVDGLTDNTPEMRAKVYEKAKGAVMRQLENMKPAPPEAMFKRQLDKLDEAIRQVEEEHAEALATDAVTEAVEVFSAGVPATPVETADPPAAERSALAEVQQPLSSDASGIQEPASFARVEAPAVEAQIHAEPEPFVEPAPAFTAPEPALDESALAEPEEEPVVTPVAPVVAAQSTMPEWPVDAVVGPEPAANHQPVDASYVPADSSRHDDSIELVEEVVESPPMPKAALDETEVAAGFKSFVQEELGRPNVPPPPPKQTGDFSWDAPFDDLPELPKPVAFEEALVSKQKEIAPADDGLKEKRRDRDARAELEDLIGFEPRAHDAASTAGAELPPEVSRAMSKLEGKSFKVSAEKPSRSGPLMIVLGLVGALAVSGGAYAFWQYREEVTSLVTSLIPADTAKPADSKPVVADPAKPAETSEAKQVDAKAKTPAEPVKEVAKAVDAAAKPTEVASLDTGPVKFMQRLLPDGSEATTDTVQLSVDKNLKEGKSVASQTKASTDVASADPASAPASDKAVTDTPPALAATQKMFLYEERLGQSSPSATPGTVAWSLKNDTSAASGKAEPMVEARLDIPGRKVSALITFKRNTDTSLPASHIVEIVFDIPKDFSEGKVEGVQRISFKQTEQDAGVALIAVPAKITDDYHMVALNDDPDARKANVELMRTRSWIDIPLLYDNGRRALITIEKGATGTEAFDKALAQWAALGPQANTIIP